MVGRVLHMIGAVVCMALVQVCVIIWVTAKLNGLYSLIDLMEQAIEAQTEFDKVLMEKYEKSGRARRKETYGKETGATTKQVEEYENHPG